MMVTMSKTPIVGFVQTLRRILLFRIKLRNNNDVISDDDDVKLISISHKYMWYNGNIPVALSGE